MNRIGCWSASPHRIVVDDYATCGPDDPSVDVVADFVNPITRTVVHLTVPVPYDRFSRLWPTLVAWLTDGWKVLHADPTSLVLPGGVVKDEQADSSDEQIISPRAEEGQRS